MSLFGGKRKVNKGLKDWVTFVKKVQKEENISYPDAIHRAKERKDKGEKWMTGGNTIPSLVHTNSTSSPLSSSVTSSSSSLMGGKKRRTMRKSKNTKIKTARRGRARKSRKH